MKDVDILQKEIDDDSDNDNLQTFPVKNTEIFRSYGWEQSV